MRDACVKEEAAASKKATAEAKSASKR